MTIEIWCQFAPATATALTPLPAAGNQAHLYFTLGNLPHVSRQPSLIGPRPFYSRRHR